MVLISTFAYVVLKKRCDIHTSLILYACLYNSISSSSTGTDVVKTIWFPTNEIAILLISKSDKNSSSSSFVPSSPMDGKIRLLFIMLFLPQSIVATQCENNVNFGNLFKKCKRKELTERVECQL